VILVPSAASGEWFMNWRIFPFSRPEEELNIPIKNAWCQTAQKGKARKSNAD
jgi:hypothetical protein